MNFVVYEHPLNEKVRLLMRLELLFDQLDTFSDVSKQQNIQPLFRVLFDLIEVLERNDIRTTLAYYLDQLEKSMLRWAAHPEIIDEVLQEKIKEAVKLQAEIANMTKACQQLKDDKFLASLRQRFGIAGGTCDFDLPQLHFWRQKSVDERKVDLEVWAIILKPIRQALEFSLLFLRESNPFHPEVAENGFFQDSCSENVSLIRVRYDLSLGYFPMVSGSKHRYSISFMKPDKCSVKTNVDDTIRFELANC
jgi:cell division protein ZapD